MFSIVMLTWNNHETFNRCMNSMTPLILDPRVKEIIIMDNGSHEIALLDFLKSIDQTYSKIKVIFGSENLGIAKGRKILFDMCKEKYILSFDSDVVIVNAKLFLEVFLKGMEAPDMMLIGGGGGNHPYFPAFYRDDIINLPSPDQPNQLTFVDEVAGWFHGFPSSILVKNGGKVYMDEQFSPFWGEDSDFCLQIKLLGGKMAIMGRGSIAHAWSSCDKPETHKTIEKMWKKFIDKWYPTFGTNFKFDFDQDFYCDVYGDQIVNKIDPKEDYFLRGIKKGNLANKKFLSKLFDLKFLNNTQVVYQDEEQHVRNFIDKHMNYQEIVKYNFKTIDDKLKSDKFAVFMISDDDKKTCKLLKTLVENNGTFPLALIFPRDSKHPKTSEYVKEKFDNYYISSLVNYYDDSIPFAVLLDQTRENKFDSIFKITSDCRNEDFTKNKLITLHMSGYDNEKEKINALGITLLQENYIHNQEQKVYKYRDIIIAQAEALITIDSVPYRNILENALRIPSEYSEIITPRLAPKYALHKLMALMEEQFLMDKTLVINLVEIDYDYDTVATNNQFVKDSCDCDIIVLNKGEKKHLKPASLNCDYYYPIQDQGDVHKNWFHILGMVDIEDYDNFVFMKDNYKLEGKMKEFFGLGRNSNKVLYSDHQGLLSLDFLNITKPFLGPFVKFTQDLENKVVEETKKGNTQIEGEKDKLYHVNMTKLFGFSSLWKCKKSEEEGETIIEYYKENDFFEPVDDFPITFFD